MIVVAVLNAVLLVIVGFFASYLALLTMLALMRKEKKLFPSKRKRRFAIVVPAHNEALVIEPTLQSLLGLDYPRDLFDVVVVADNCDDETVALASALDVVVYERNDPHLRGKGYALRWCFDRLLKDRHEYEAVVVVDADSVVSDNLLVVLNHYIELGAEVIQCSDLVDPRSLGWTAEMSRLSFLLYNFVRPLGRSVMGCSVGLKGNGMCFAAKVLSTVPWSSFSRNEDVEYGLELLLGGVAAQFAPEAKLIAKMPQNAKNAQSQRVRWETGRFPMIHKYSYRLISAALRRHSFKLLDAFVELVTPSLVNMFAVAGGMIALNLLMASLGIEWATRSMMLWIGVLALGLFHVTVGIVAAKAEASTLLTLLHVPRYFLWKLKLYVGVQRSRNRQNEWIRTTREVLPNDSQKKRSSDTNSENKTAN